MGDQENIKTMGLRGAILEARRLASEGQLDLALRHCEGILGTQPDQADTLHLMGLILHQQGATEKGLEHIRRAVEADVSNPLFHANLGRMSVATKDYVTAAACFDRACALSPEDADLAFALGHAHLSNSQNVDAAEAFRRALDLRPQFLDAANGLGNALDEQGLAVEAEAVFREALSWQETAEIHYNLGNVLRDQHRTGEAAAAFLRAIELRPDYAEAHVHLAFVYFLEGRYAEAWPEYEWRWHVPAFGGPRGFEQPQWNGGLLNNSTLYIYAEQGFGDTLQFSRYASLAKAKGGTIYMECPPALLRLMERVEGINGIVTKGQPLPPIDVQVPLLSLPLLFQTTLDTVPADIPYLHADPSESADWKGRLSEYKGLKIGLAWQGTAERRGTLTRALPLDALEPLLGRQDVSLFSLQKDQPAAGSSLPETIVDLGPELADFATTAAIMDNLDLIISIDTAVAHLAGGLGRPVWVLLTTASDWRWLRDRDDSPWYPTARLFRQTSPRRWEDVVERVDAALDDLLR